MRISDWLQRMSYELLQGNLEESVDEVIYDSRKANSVNEIILVHNDEMKLFLSREKFHNVLEEMFWGEEECRDMEEV